MRIQYAKQFHLSSLDKSILSDLSSTMIPYLKSEDDTKAYNIIREKPKMLTEADREKVINVIAGMKELITKQIEVCLGESKNVPEQASGLIRRPKEFMIHTADNYRVQLSQLDRIVEILTVEAADDLD